MCVCGGDSVCTVCVRKTICIHREGGDRMCTCGETMCVYVVRQCVYMCGRSCADVWESECVEFACGRQSKDVCERQC